MTDDVSKMRLLMARFSMGFVVGGKDVDKHYAQYEAQLRTLVEQRMYELIGEDYREENIYISNKHEQSRRHALNQLRAEQRQNIKPTLDKLFGSEK